MTETREIEVEVIESRALYAVGDAMTGAMMAHEGITKAFAEVVELCGMAGDLSTPEQEQFAADAIEAYNRISGPFDKCRLKFGEPYRLRWLAVNKLAADTREDADESIEEVRKLMSALQTKRLEARRAEERRIQQEKDRLAAEERQAQARARQAETAEQRQAEIKQVQEIRQQRTELFSAAAVPAPIVSPVKTRTRWEATVTDPVEAYKHRPDFFELKPKMNVINESIRGGFRGCLGIEVKEVAKV